MGLFSGKKKTYVSSVAYNLGNEDDDRVDFLKYTVLNATLQNQPMAKSIAQGYLTGGGMALRSAYQYAQQHYTDGVPTSSSLFYNSPDHELVSDIVGSRWPGRRIAIINVFVGTAEFTWWAEQYLAENFGYDRVEGKFYRPPAGVDATATVTYDYEANGTIRIILINADNSVHTLPLDPVGFTLMASYLHGSYRAVLETPMVAGTSTHATVGGDVAGTTFTIDKVEIDGETRTTTVKTVVTIAGGTTTVDTETTVTLSSHPLYFIYKIGAGTYPSLDLLASEDALDSPYFPSVPLRVDNKDVTDDAHQDTELYKTSKRLLKKAGANIDELADKINDNESIADIDYAFVVFGVALNTKTEEGQRYLYRFFEYLRTLGGPGTKATYDDWRSGLFAALEKKSPNSNKLSIHSAKNRAGNYDVEIQWDYLDTTAHAGVIAPGAKKGDVVIEMGSSREILDLGGDMFVDASKLYARKQLDADTFEQIEVGGLYYENYIYKGKSVSISAYDMFHDDDESGFIVPLNQAIIKRTPLTEFTNLSYHCTFMVFNSYKVVKQKWYQTGIFKVIMIALSIVLIIINPPAGIASLAAALAPILVVSLTVALAIVATLTVFAMMVLMKVLTPAFIDLFGEKWGPLLAAVAMLAVGSFVSTGSFTQAFTTLQLNAQSLLQMTSAVSKIFGGYVQGQMLSMDTDLTKLKTESEARLEEIEKLSKELLGPGTNLIDLEAFTKATYMDLFEKPQDFLNRTLITGSEICEITRGLVENFTEVGLRLPTTG